MFFASRIRSFEAISTIEQDGISNNEAIFIKIMVKENLEMNLISKKHSICK